MNVSNRDSRGHEDDTDLDIAGIEDSIHLDLETGAPVFEQGSPSQDTHDTEGDIFLELVYIEEDDSCTLFTFDSSPD